MIETSHKGYRIYYSENSDKWVATDLELDAPSLSALKDKISKLDSANRKAAAIDVAIIGPRYSSTEIRDGSVVEVKRERGKVRVMVMAERGSGKSRRGMDLAEIMLPTPENLDIARRVIELEERANAIRTEARKLKETIPTVTEGDLAGLIKAQGKDE